MATGLDDLIVGGQLRVGTGICPPIKEGDTRINGSMMCEGPAVFGAPNKEAGMSASGATVGGFDENVATLMVARTTNADEDCEPANRSLFVHGNVAIDGDVGTSQTLQIWSHAPTALKINGSITAIDINGKTTIDAFGDAKFAIGTDGDTLSGRFNTADGRPKPFDIKHPTKGNGHRLRYACIEGPEVGVYHRGRLRRGKEISLPYYWKDLVHMESITVQLQPVGAHQDIIVKRWDEQKIYLQSNGGLPIDCFYHVYGERKDINPLITEYEGDSWKDYPDPNYNPELTPAEKRTFTDSRFSGPPNTITM